jgi:hypothetical protein
MGKQRIYSNLVLLGGGKDNLVQMNNIEMILDQFYHPGKIRNLKLKCNKKSRTIPTERQFNTLWGQHSTGPISNVLR